MVTKEQLFEVRNKRLKLFLKNGYIYTGQIIQFLDDNSFVFFDKYGNNSNLNINMIEGFTIVDFPEDRK
jgi:hypothetical protein